MVTSEELDTAPSWRAPDELINALLCGRMPTSLSSRAPRSHGAWIDHVDLDEDGCPTDACLQAIRCIGFQDGLRWMQERFVPIAESLPYATVTPKVHHPTRTGIVEVAFSTKGFSGAEAFVDAVTSNPALAVFVEQVSRGGHYRFSFKDS